MCIIHDDEYDFFSAFFTNSNSKRCTIVRCRMRGHIIPQCLKHLRSVFFLCNWNKILGVLCVVNGCEVKRLSDNIGRLFVKTYIVVIFLIAMP